ncbi:MAG: DUF502 domain-containing protein [Pseudomonadota bacterium]
MVDNLDQDIKATDKRPLKGKAPRKGPAKSLRLAARIRNYFFAGILVTAPIGITFWISWSLVEAIDGWVTPMVPPRWNPETYLPFHVPGFGLVVIFVALTLVGLVAAGFLGRVFMRGSEQMLNRVPVVRSLYSATKQIFETVLAQKSTAFRQVALIEYPCRGCWAIGFITGQTVGEVQRQTDDMVINVFVPATPNPTTGFLLFVPSRDVHVLDMSVEDGIKLVISGGIVAPPTDGERTAEKIEIAPTPEPEPEPVKRKFSLAAKLRNYFLAGVLVAAPISITFWLVWKFVSYVDNRVVPLVPPNWNPETYLPFDIPGLGLIVSFVGLTLIGMFAAGFMGKLIMKTGEGLLARVPVVRNIYSAIKQILETVLAQQSNAFRQVVLIEYPRKEVWAIGFLTGESEGHVQSITEGETVNVFLPTTPNPTSGFLLFVPAAEARTLTMTVEEGLKMVVSGGIVTPPDRYGQDGIVGPTAEAARDVARTKGGSMIDKETVAGE